MNKLVAAGPRLYVLTDDGKLWLRSEYHDACPTDDLGAELRIVDVAVTVDPVDLETADYVIYVVLEDGRLLHDYLKFSIQWKEITLP